MHQERMFPGRVVGTDLVNPDFAAFARAFGAHGETVERTDEFAAALERALAAGRPAVLAPAHRSEAINPRTTLSAIRAARAMSDGARSASRGCRSRSATTPTRSWPATCCSSRGASRSTRDGNLVAGDVVAQTRQVFGNIALVLEAAGAGFGDVVKVTVFLTDIDDRAAVNTVRQEVFGDGAARQHARRGEPARDPGRPHRGRSGRPRAVTDPYNAIITRSSRPRAAGAAARARLLVKDLIDTAASARRTARGSTPTTSRPDRDRGRAARRRRSGRRRQGEPARVRVGRHEPERLVRHRPEPAAPGAHDRRLVGRQRGGARGGPLRHRHRHRHGLLDPAARVVLRRRRLQAELGAGAGGRRVSALPQLRHRRADGDERPGGGGDVVGARRRRRSRSRGSPG